MFVYSWLASEDMEDDLVWLRYWVVLAFVSLVEMVVDPLVDYFPAYLLAKCAFLIWCMAPGPNNGVSFIFTQVLCTWIKNTSAKKYHTYGMLKKTLKSLKNLPFFQAFWKIIFCLHGKFRYPPPPNRKFHLCEINIFSLFVVRCFIVFHDMFRLYSLSSRNVT